MFEEDPAAWIAKPRVGKSVPYCLNDDQVRSLLEACADNWTGQRSRSILLTFLGAGLRVSELAALSMDDINLGAGTMLVKGKDSKERTVPIGGPLSGVLEGWLNLRGSFLAGETHRALFVTKFRETAPNPRSIQPGEAPGGTSGDIERQMLTPYLAAHLRHQLHEKRR